MDLHNLKTINIRTGGIYDGALLQAVNTKLKMKAGGEADVNSSDLIEVTIVAGGNLTIHGTPKTVRQKNIIGGRVIYKNKEPLLIN